MEIQTVSPGRFLGDNVFITAGGHTPEATAQTAETRGGLVVPGRHYTTNVSFFRLSADVSWFKP